MIRTLDEPRDENGKSVPEGQRRDDRITSVTPTRTGDLWRRLPSAHYAALTQRIRVQSADGGAQTVGVTSCSSGEGVSTVAANLAISASQMEHRPVLLVDANTERPVVGRWFRRPSGPGWSDLLAGRALVDDCICSTQVSNLYVVPAGHGYRRGAWAIDVNRIAPTLANLKDRFGWIVLDLPVASALTPCFILAAALDGVVLVVEAGRVSEPVIRRARDGLEDVHAHLLGVVLNKQRD